MTTIIAIASQRDIRIFTDCAVVDARNGTLAGMVEKVLRWDDRPLALSAMSNDVRESAGFAQRHIVPCARGADVDGTFAALGRLRRPLMASHSIGGAVFLLAGIKADGKPRMSLFAPSQNQVGITPWTLTPVQGDCLVLGNVTAEDELDPEELTRDPERYAPKWFQASRKMVTIGGQTFCGTGGQLQMTTVSTEGVKSRVIAYWPDWLGQRIDAGRKFVPVL